MAEKLLRGFELHIYGVRGEPLVHVDVYTLDGILVRRGGKFELDPAKGHTLKDLGKGIAIVLPEIIMNSGLVDHVVELRRGAYDGMAATAIEDAMALAEELDDAES